jgi:hypothetical protein
MILQSFKEISFKYVLPLTVISFFTVTQWWYALPVDGVDTLYWGFPFPYVGEGWHTSGSLQFFILEVLADLLTYFLLCFALVSGMHKWVPSITSGKLFVRSLRALAIFYILGIVLVLSVSNPVFNFKRPYEWRMIDHGLVFIWQRTPRPDHPGAQPSFIPSDSIK